MSSPVCGKQAHNVGWGAPKLDEFFVIIYRAAAGMNSREDEWRHIRGRRQLKLDNHYKIATRLHRFQAALVARADP